MVHSGFRGIGNLSFSDIGWPQQPLTEKVLKFNMSFYDSVKKINISSQIIEFKNLYDFEDLRIDFPGFRNPCSLIDLRNT